MSLPGRQPFRSQVSVSSISEGIFVFCIRSHDTGEIESEEPAYYAATCFIESHIFSFSFCFMSVRLSRKGSCRGPTAFGA